MPKRTGVSPTFAEVEAHMLAARKKHPDLVTIKNVLPSEEGRAIYAVTVTDKNVPDSDKQRVLIIAGQHGNEETGRMTALALLDHLLAPAGGETRTKQKVVIMPNVNPDGGEYDLHATVSGVYPNLDHDVVTGPLSPEGLAVEMVACALQPEVFVDMHAMGGIGCGHDMVLYPATRPYTEDDNLIHEIAAKMAAAGEAEGVPHMTHPLTWSGWGGNDPEEPSTTQFAYRNFKSIVMLTESCEHNDVVYPAELRDRVGLARLKALLAYGNSRHPKLFHSGYPCSALGMFYRGVVAVGKTAAARRRSRVELWKNVANIKRAIMKLPERPKRKEFVVEYDGQPLRCGVGFQLCARGKLRVVEARLDGKKLRPSPTSGYMTWQADPATFVVVANRTLTPGPHEIVVDFE